MILQTNRLLLREMTENDFDALYKIWGDAEVMRHYPYTFDEQRVHSWIARNRERYKTFGFGLWAVCLKDTGELIGDCGLTMQQIGSEIKPEIGYHIRADKQRNGYATEAAKAVRDWAFRSTPFNEIYSYMKYTNEPSAKTAMAYGCTQVDEFADEVNEITRVFAISRTQWQACLQQETEREAAK
ncbi:MAG: GNAT family N-acetyltransferase [Oscillospiraceae bacterium]|nr:GNAT family N-acetyltransferase [Oscillospiraceae bacterium]